MKPENKDLLKEALVIINQTKQQLRSTVEFRLNLGFAKKSLVSLYLACPSKVQYALAKVGIRMVVKKKKAQIEEFIRH